MLKLLRKKGVAKKVIWAVAIIIIISFGFLGTAYLLTGNPEEYVGEIFGQKVSRDTFSDAFKSVEVQSIIQYGDNYKKFKKFLNLESDTWDRLILLHEAKKRRITISNQEVIKAIEDYQFFQRDGQFDTLLYNDILQYVFRKRPRDFEEDVRDRLKLHTLYTQETAHLTVLDEDVFEEYTKRNEKIQISYALVTEDQFKKDVIFNEADARQYYTENKDEFLLPPAVNVDYIRLDFPKPPNAEKKEDENIEEDTSAKDAIKEKAGLIFQQLLINPDMAQAAKDNALIAQTSGFFSKEQPNLTLGWPFPLLNKTFELDEDEINEPFETPNGMVIVKLKEKRDSFIQEYEEAKEKVKEAVIKKESKKIAQQKAGQYLESITQERAKAEPKEFEQIIKDLKLELQKTPEFTRGQYLPKIGIAEKFQDAAFALNESNPISEVIETPIGYAILHHDATIPVDKEKYTEEKESLTEGILNERRNKTFSDFLTKLKLKAKLVNNIPKSREN